MCLTFGISPFFVPLSRHKINKRKLTKKCL